MGQKELAVSSNATKTAGRKLGQAEAMREIAAANQRTIDLPVLGVVTLPPSDQLVWYGAVAVLAAVEIIEWPVAVVLAVGHAILEKRHTKTVEAIGNAFEEAALAEIG